MESMTKKLLAVLLAIVMGIFMASAQTDTVKHTVGRGETLASIAKRYGTTNEKIIELNPDASQFIYVGMELTIPVTASGNEPSIKSPSALSSSDSQPSSYREVSNTNLYNNTTKGETSHKHFAVAQYQLGDFREAKYTSCYGLGLVFTSISQWGAVHVGADFNFSINAGIVDNWGCLIDFGPSVRFDIVDNVFVNVPINVRCAVTFPEGSTDTETNWGLQIPPALHVFFTEKFGLFVGPQMTIAFSSESKPSFGLVAGLSYEF